MEKRTRFKIVYLPKNLGHGRARSISVEKSSNSFIALMDADDISLHDRFEKQLSAFATYRELDVVGGQISEFIDSPSNIIGIRDVPLNDVDIKKFLKKRCPMNQVSVMFKKEAVQSVGGYLDFYCEEDYYLWARMALNKKIFHNVSDVLVNVRIGDLMSERRGGLKYFLSEKRLQQYLLKKRLISFPRYIFNVAIRFFGEVLVSPKIRLKLFKKIRKKSDSKTFLKNNNYHANNNKYCFAFSVAMCVYEKDNPIYFDEAINSVINQTVIPDELVLVVDGPIGDDIQQVVKKWSNSLLTEICYEKE